MHLVLFDERTKRLQIYDIIFVQFWARKAGQNTAQVEKKNVATDYTPKRLMR